MALLGIDLKALRKKTKTKISELEKLPYGNFSKYRIRASESKNYYQYVPYQVEILMIMSFFNMKNNEILEMTDGYFESIDLLEKKKRECESRKEKLKYQIKERIKELESQIKELDTSIREISDEIKTNKQEREMVYIQKKLVPFSGLATFNGVGSQLSPIFHLVRGKYSIEIKEPQKPCSFELNLECLLSDKPIDKYDSRFVSMSDNQFKIEASGKYMFHVLSTEGKKWSVTFKRTR